MRGFLGQWLGTISCAHPENAVRCVHGDEIHQRGGARRACMLCNASLPGPLPTICTVTDAPHRSAEALS